MLFSAKQFANIYLSLFPKSLATAPARLSAFVFRVLRKKGYLRHWKCGKKTDVANIAENIKESALVSLWVSANCLVPPHHPNSRKGFEVDEGECFCLVAFKFWKELW